MGGMAAQIPIKNDPAANDAAMEKVVADKLREVRAGHDGTWVAHPGLCRSRRRSSTSTCRRRIRSIASARTCSVTARRSAARPRGRDHREGPPAEHQRRHPLSRGVARRPRLRAALQPDGRRGHRRDLAHAALAVDSPPTRMLDDGRAVDAGALSADPRRRAADDRHRVRISKRAARDLRRPDPRTTSSPIS